MTDLEALADIHRRYRAHETLAEDLLMERDQVIYDYLTADGPARPTIAEIARIIGSDRSWPGRIRDSFPERYRVYREHHAARQDADPEDADYLEYIEAAAQKYQAARRKRQPAE